MTETINYLAILFDTTNDLGRHLRARVALACHLDDTLRTRNIIEELQALRRQAFGIKNLYMKGQQSA
jgi:hypothetical protein